MSHFTQTLLLKFKLFPEKSLNSKSNVRPPTKSSARPKSSKPEAAKQRPNVGLVDLVYQVHLKKLSGNIRFNRED